MADYSKLIDEETWAFIKATDAWYPPDTVDYPVDKQRDIYNRMCREFFAGCPKDVTAEDSVIETEGFPVPIRSYAKAAAAPRAQVVYLHGGGFVVGGLESHDDVCAEICERTSYPVISVDYRLAPEHHHPAAFDDALAGFRHACGTSDLPVVMVGDSAGGNLAAAVCHATRDDARAPIGQVLIYPGLGADITKGSYVTHAEAPMLSTRDIAFYSGIRTGGTEITGDPTYAPLHDSDFSGLPPTVIVSAECDPLSDDGSAYRDALITAGGKALWVNEPGLVHGYLRARHTVERARQSFSTIVRAVSILGYGRWVW